MYTRECFSRKHQSTELGDISDRACISYDTPDLLADGYVSFYQRPRHNGVSACSVQIVIYRSDGI